VVVPAYEVADRIGATVDDLRRALFDVAANGGVEIVVVDDGSSDATADAARAAGADRVIVFPANRGKGAAVRAGMLAAGGRTIVFTDADLSYRPEQIVRLLAGVEDGYDVVVGSRRHEETNIIMRGRRLRELTGRGFNLLTRGVLHGRYLDTQCGLKAFRDDAARRIFTNSRVDRFAFDVEMFHLVERYHLKLLEVPVDLSNTQTSTVRLGRESVRMLRDLARLRRWARQDVYDRGAPEAAGPESPPAELGSEA